MQGWRCRALAGSWYVVHEWPQHYTLKVAPTCLSVELYPGNTICSRHLSLWRPGHCLSGVYGDFMRFVCHHRDVAATSQAMEGAVGEAAVQVASGTIKGGRLPALPLYTLSLIHI